MTPRQQRFHLRLWLILTPVLLGLLVTSVVLRPGPVLTSESSP